MKKMRLAGWVLSVLLAAFLIIASAMGKFTQWEGKAEMFAKMGWSTEVMHTIGIVEVGIALMFLIPRTAFVGAILLTGYLGGATATHVRIGDAFIFPILVGVVAWIALGLRDSRIFCLATTSGGSHESCKT
ncbi:MAG: DoxX family protein [Pirellulaceae bacterium]|nr:DoxX family protein [Pirellulaceae bacterium]